MRSCVVVHGVPACNNQHTRVRSFLQLHVNVRRYFGSAITYYMGKGTEIKLLALACSDRSSWHLKLDARYFDSQIQNRGAPGGVNLNRLLLRSSFSFHSMSFCLRFQALIAVCVQRTRDINAPVQLIYVKLAINVSSLRWLLLLSSYS